MDRRRMTEPTSQIQKRMQYDIQMKLVMDTFWYIHVRIRTNTLQMAGHYHIIPAWTIKSPSQLCAKSDG